ncbi:MAG: helix-turn-helix domain-containing protein [Rhodospirillales bacterium]|nr:helix-turn-helix domain-containing protein [Rhodospirillales bacterium]
MPDDLNGNEIVDTEIISSAERVGAGLREVRERLGWRLPEVAEGLRIRMEFLTAIEEGNLSSLPGPAYRAGFVRSYAQALGLDGEEILRRFREAGQLGELPKTEIQFLAPVPDRGVPKGAIVFIGFIVILAAYGLWYHHTEQARRLAQSVPQVPAELQPLAIPPKVTPPATVNPAPNAATPAAVAKPAPTQLAAGPTTSTAVATPAPLTPAAPVTSPTPTTPIAPAAPSPPVASAPLQPVAPTSTPVPGAGMVITATQDAWVQVSDASGNILFSKVLHAGDSWPVPQEPGLVMTTGNAGGTIITTNGQPGQPLGAAGVVLHGYQLTPQAGSNAASAAPSNLAPVNGAAQ